MGQFFGRHSSVGENVGPKAVKETCEVNGGFTGENGSPFKNTCEAVGIGLNDTTLPTNAENLNRQLCENLETDSQDNSNMFVAMFDYDARGKEELSFKKGEKMEIVEETKNNWWLATSKTTKLKGMIPSNFVAKLNSIDAES